MHETGVVRSLLRRIQAAAVEAGATRIVSIQLQIGALSQFSAAHFREHFEEEARGTLAAGAALEIETSKAVMDPRAQDVTIVGLTFDVPDEHA